MPPQVTFVKLTDKTIIPIKIFVNKSSNDNQTSIQNKKTIAINSKSLITLNNQPFQIQLSKNYLNSLIIKLKPKILPILIYNKELKSQELILDDNIKIIIPQELIFAIRQTYGLLDVEQQFRGSKTSFSDFTLHLLQAEKKKHTKDDDKIDYTLNNCGFVGRLSYAIRVFIKNAN